VSVTETTAARLDGRDRVLTLTAASLGYSVVQLDVFVVNLAVRQIQPAGAAVTLASPSGGGGHGLRRGRQPDGPDVQP
jgi:hypothetical protein